MQMLWVDPAHRARRAAAARRVIRPQLDDPRADAEPGKILHEMRGGEMAALGEVPFGHYYGSVDATPLFVMLAGAYAQRTGDYALDPRAVARHRARAGLDRRRRRPRRRRLHRVCARRRDGPRQPGLEGFARRRLPRRRPPGRRARSRWSRCRATSMPPSAWPPLCARELGMPERAAELEAQAERAAPPLRRGVLVRGDRHLCAGARRRKAPCKVRTSNAGHALATGIALPRPRAPRRRAADAALVLFRLGHPHRRQGEARYNPMSYHNGSIWPHDNALIAQGWRGTAASAASVCVRGAGAGDAATWTTAACPELFCGFRRRPGRGPTLYPAACSPQAWAAGAPFLHAAGDAGLEFDQAARESS